MLTDKDRVRLTGFADFVGYRRDKQEESEMRDTLIEHAKYQLPDLKWKSSSPLWIGFRPMSPDGLPYTGRDKKCSNLFLSCGHGSNGWTTSAGTGRLLSAIIAQEFGISQLTPEESKIAELLNPNRFNLPI